MLPKLLFGTATVLARKKKTQLIVVGLQFVFIAYKILKKKDK